MPRAARSREGDLDFSKFAEVPERNIAAKKSIFDPVP
jgi:hypothetical protein